MLLLILSFAVSVGILVEIGFRLHTKWYRFIVMPLLFVLLITTVTLVNFVASAKMSELTVRPVSTTILVPFHNGSLFVAAGDYPIYCKLENGKLKNTRLWATHTEALTFIKTNTVKSVMIEEDCPFWASVLVLCPDRKFIVYTRLSREKAISNLKDF